MDAREGFAIHLPLAWEWDETFQSWMLRAGTLLVGEVIDLSNGTHTEWYGRTYNLVSNRVGPAIRKPTKSEVMNVIEDIILSIGK